MDGAGVVEQIPSNVQTNGRSLSMTRVRRSQRIAAFARTAPLLVLVGLFLVTGFRGVDFGEHWDEDKWQIQPVRDMATSGLLLPRATIYPAFCKWLVLWPAIPGGIKAGLRSGGNIRAVQAGMVATVNAPGYLVTIRRLFILVSALAIVWVYGAALALRRQWWEALVAAATLGLSWEYAYHARWVATDCIVVQFSALTLLLVALFQRDQRPKWLYAAAISTGLATGTKFPGVILLVPVLLSSALSLPSHPLARGLRAHAFRAFALVGIAFAVYLVTTPATVLEPFAFYERLSAISRDYAKGHAGYTVTSTWDHLRVALTYFAVAFFSPYRLVAVLVFGSVLLGAYVWVRHDRRQGLVILSFPIAFLMFFCGKYRAAIVRNHLLIAPFLCLFAGRGVAELVRWASRRWVRWSLAGVLAATAVVQAVWLVRAAESIRTAEPKGEVKDAIAYVASHAGLRFRLSNRVRKLALEQQLVLPPNVTDDHDADRFVLFGQADGPGPWHWRTNDPSLAEAVFGPREVNIAWYATWTGRDRVLIMTRDKARGTGVPIAK